MKPTSSTDRLPPHCPESERAILGCALLDASLAPDLRLEWFFDLRHKAVAEAILGLSAAGSPVDIVAVGQRLPNSIPLILEAQNACHSPANFTYWRDILNEKMALRRVILVAHSAIDAANDPGADAAAVVDCFERDALAIGDSDGGADVVDIRQTIHGLAAGYERALAGERPGLDTGLPNLDRILGGMKPQQLLLLAARPSVGKTGLACRIIEYIGIEQGQPVGFFSLEMSGPEIVHRLACSLGRVDGAQLEAIRKGRWLRQVGYKTAK